MIDFQRIGKIAESTGSLVMADIAHIAGLVAVGEHPSPIPYCDFVTTTTHKTLRGPRGGMIMCREAFAKDLDRTVFPGIQGGPLVHIIAAKAVCFQEALQPEYRSYIRQVVKNAKTLCETIKNRGYRIVSGGTDNHLILVDVFSKGITGKQAEKALEQAGMTVNKNTIPFDGNCHGYERYSSWNSGLDHQGMKEEEMRVIGKFICDTLDDINNVDLQQRIRSEVKELTHRFPLYESKM